MLKSRWKAAEETDAGKENPRENHAQRLHKRYVRVQYEAAPDGGISCGSQPADMSVPTVDVNRAFGAPPTETQIGA